MDIMLVRTDGYHGAWTLLVYISGVLEVSARQSSLEREATVNMVKDQLQGYIKVYIDKKLCTIVI